MDDGRLVAATAVAAVGSGLVGGVFFAFSTFVMRALERVPAAEGIRAMQAINVTALNPLFLGALFGTGLLGLGLGVAAVRAADGAAAVLLVVGSAVYVIGEVVVTAAFHVPRNEALDALDADAAGSAEAWRRFLVEWTMGNHVRTLSGVVAAACFVAALRVR